MYAHIHATKSNMCAHMYAHKHSLSLNCMHAGPCRNLHPRRPLGARPGHTHISARPRSTAALRCRQPAAPPRAPRQPAAQHGMVRCPTQPTGHTCRYSPVWGCGGVGVWGSQPLPALNHCVLHAIQSIILFNPSCCSIHHAVQSIICRNCPRMPPLCHSPPLSRGCTLLACTHLVLLQRPCVVQECVGSCCKTRASLLYRMRLCSH